MAKNSVVQRELKRNKILKRFSEKRAQLKEAVRKAGLTGEGIWEALQALQKLPVNASPVRFKRRCSCCGRPRGVYRKFGICRLCLRKHAMQGLVPGVEKSSW